MKLQVLSKQVLNVVGGDRALVLCDADGEALPCQTRVVVESEMAALARVTVTFLVDGENVVIA